jgi:ornithine decarboxylase
LSKKFGTSVDEAVRLLSAAPDVALVPYGVTFHVGSQCVTPQSWKRALGRCGILMSQLERRGVRLEMVNIGGGFPAHYVEPVPDLAEVAAAVNEGLERLPYRPDLIAAEPGRALVAESAVMVATIIGVDDRGGQRWVYLDVGGYNGMMEAVQTGGRWAFPLGTSRDVADVPLIPCTVTGPSCDSTDTMFYDVDLPCSLETGDRLYIGSAGAYTLSYASNFNGFMIPKVHAIGRSRPRVPKFLDLARGA